MRDLLALLCASSIELRSGGLTAEAFLRDDVVNQIALHSAAPDETTQALQNSFKKYPTVQFRSMLLTSETITDLVLKTKLPTFQIQAELQQHPYFAKVEDIPSWRALWLSSEVSADAHNGIVRRFEADFDMRVFYLETEIKHIIGLGLWLSEMSFPNWNKLGVVEKIKSYIADVYDHGEAGPDDMHEVEVDFGGAFGLAYMYAHDPRFSELSDFQSAQRANWINRGYPAVACYLEKLMTEDSAAFLREVCFTNPGPARFARRGVLKEIPAERFASIMMKAPYGDFRQVAMALAIRYDQVTAEPEIAAELSWLEDVRRHLLRLNGEVQQIAAFHQSILITEYISKTIDKAMLRLPQINAALPGQ